MAVSPYERNPLDTDGIRGPVHRLFETAGKVFEVEDIRSTLDTTFDFRSLMKLWTQAGIVISDDPQLAGNRYHLTTQDVYRYLRGEPKPRQSLGRALLSFYNNDRQVASIWVSNPFHQLTREHQAVIPADKGRPAILLGAKEVSFSGSASINSSKSVVGKGGNREFGPSESVIYTSVAHETTDESGDQRWSQDYVLSYSSNPNIGRPSSLTVPENVALMLDLHDADYIDLAQYVAGTLTNLAGTGNNT